MAEAVASSTRFLVLRMDAEQSLELFKAGGTLLTGALGLKLFDRLTARWRRKRQEPVELTAKIIDDGDRFREMLLEEVKSLRAEKDTVLERAHKAEIDLSIVRSENVTLRSRIDRKDEQCKALQSQVIGLGHAPVILTGPAGRGDGSGTPGAAQ